MTRAAEMTKTQERRWYRYAVQLSLEQFYGKSSLEASRLAREWWKRLSVSGCLDFDIFMHAEPLNTAAGIAQARVIPISSSNREAYHGLLDRSRDLVLARGRVEVKLRPKNAAVKKPALRRKLAFG